MDNSRINIGIWNEVPSGAKLSSEGVQRLIGFIVEGVALSGKYRLIVCVANGNKKEVCDDFEGLEAKRYVDWDVVEPPKDYSIKMAEADWGLVDDLKIARYAVEMANFANNNVDVVAWMTNFPQFTGALLLDKPVVTLLPDAIPYEFPLGWKDPNAWILEHSSWTAWRRLASRVFRFSAGAVTYSHHVKDRHIHELLAYEGDVTLVPHPPPDLIDLLPFVKNRRKSVESRVAASNILREISRDRRQHFLSSYPFESSRFIMVSTQDRPTKNILRVVEAVKELNDEGYEIKLILTASLEQGNTKLTDYILQNEMQLDVFSMHALPRKVHAALYHCATMSIHPAFFEGGRVVFPFYEGVSVGTPCVYADGPHTKEAVQNDPAMAEWVFDPYDTDHLKQQIKNILSDPEKVLDQQEKVFLRHKKNRNWGMAADEYCSAIVRCANE